MSSRILFVEDEASIHFAMREYFGAMGYLVDCAQDAAAAFKRIAATPYAVVIADLRLSGDHGVQGEPEGLAFIEQVRRDHPGTRVLVLTACGEELKGEALRLGADCFLQKPQSLSHLAEVVGKLCGWSSVTMPGRPGSLP